MASSPPRDPGADPCPARGPTLRIVAVNDIYSLERLPRLRSLVAHHAATDPADALLVTVAGDFLAPSILSSLDGGRGMVDCLNAVGVTHAILGNHEDDVPTDELRRRVRELRATWINTNVRSFDPPLPSHDIVEIGAPNGRRVRVGLVGVVMDDGAVYRRPPFGGAPVAPPLAAALAEAIRLVAEAGCACVIPITHQPIAGDRALARAQSTPPLPPFPVILGGHEHEVFLEHSDATWIVKAGADSAHAVVVDLAWPAQPPPAGTPDLPTVAVRLDDVALYPEDTALRVRVETHMRPVHELEAATLLQLPPGLTLSSVGTRARQTSMGSLLCSRVRDALGADLCLFNGGGIRAGRDYTGHVTYGDLKAEVPFDNEVVVASIPGGVLRDAIAASRALAPVESGGYLQVDDRVAIDSTRRITAIGGAPLDEDRDYRVALVRDLLVGLDRIEPLVRFAEAHPDRVPPADSGREIKVVLVEAFSVALWRQMGGFDKIDENHDGVVTELELVSAISRLTNEPPSHVAADLVIHALDVDRDQVISRADAESSVPPLGGRKLE